MTKPHLTIYIRVKITLILIIAVVFASFSQNSIGIGTVTPQQSAILDVYSTHKGFLPPRMSATEMDVINSPSEGLIVYCLDCNPKGIYVRSGNEFKMIQFFAKPVENLSIPDVSVIIGATFFNISPTLTPSGATVDYELITNPIGGTMEGTRINISPNLDIEEYNITVKAKGIGNYIGETEATFTLYLGVLPPDDFVIDFKDENFETAVKGSLGIIVPNEVVKYRNVKDVIELDVSWQGITNMEEIRYFTSLIELFCHDNQLTSLDLSQNTVLKRLNYSNNQLTSLDLSRNTVLESLNCSNNQLRSLDLSRNTVLESLDCSDNHLTSLDLSRNTVLKEFDCSNNQLTSLDIRGMRWVGEYLIFSNTTLQMLKVHQNIKDHQSIIDLKINRDSITISTYSASPGSTTYNPICNNYNPRIGGGTCND